MPEPVDQTEPFSMWTLYDHPSDFPSGYVARRSVVTAGCATHTDDVFVTSNFEVLRAYFEAHGYQWIPRYQHDDPVILGVYL